MNKSEKKQQQTTPLIHSLPIHKHYKDSNTTNIHYSNVQFNGFKNVWEGLTKGQGEGRFT